MFKRTKTLVSWLLLGGILSAAAAHGASVFNFDSDVPGTSTPFTDSNAGISATFNNNGPAGGFSVDPPGQPGTFHSLSGNVLADPGIAGLNNLMLSIAFSPDISSISLNFAVNAGSPTLFTLSAFESGVPVASVTANDSIPTGFTFPEGVISFTGANFNSVTLSTTAPDFVIDNIVVSSAVPEPASLLPLGLMLFSGVGLLSEAKAVRKSPGSAYKPNPEFRSIR